MGSFAALLKTSLAYKLLVLHLMLGELDHFAKHLRLDSLRSVDPVDVSELYVAPVRFEFGGSFETHGYAVSFREGRLWNIVKKKFTADRSFLESYSDWATTPSMIDSKTAYMTATQWLAAISVDVEVLETRHKPAISQLEVETRLLPKGSLAKRASRQTSLLPLFTIRWGDETIAADGRRLPKPPVVVRVLGTTKELVELSVFEGSVSLRPPLAVPDGAEIDKLPDAPFQQLLQEPDFRFEKVAEMLRVSDEYRDQVRKMMFQEARYLGRQLGLLSETSSSATNIESGFVRPPRFGFGGNIVISNLNFCFNESGKLSSLEKLNPFRQGESYESLIRTSSLTDTNGACQLATNWAKAIGVDLSGLDRAYKRSVVRESVPKSGTRIQTPFFQVYWGPHDARALSFRIFGASKELLELRVGDSSFLQRPALTVDDAQRSLTR